MIAVPAARGLVALSLLVVIAYLAAMLAATDGHFVAQVTDLYLTCQYAKSFAEGHPFQYNAGEPATTGSTSLLHTALLGIAHAVGARGEALVAFAILSGAAFFVATVLLVRRIGLRLGNERDGLLAGVLVALGGPVVWGFLYGADVALFMLLYTWLFDRLLAEWHRGERVGVAAAGSLLALARPEGLLIAIALLAVPRLAPKGASPPTSRARLLSMAPFAASLAVLVLNVVVTGQGLGTSVKDKSLFATYGIVDGAAVAAEYGVEVIRGVLLGLYPSTVAVGLGRGWSSFFFPPLGLLLAGLAVATARDEERTLLRFFAGLTAVLLVLLLPNMYAGAHFHRHLMWAFPVIMVLAAVGLGPACTALARGDARVEKDLFRGTAGLLVLLGALSTARFMDVYADLAGQVWARDLAAARWISKNLPAGVSIANLATSVEYLTGHRSVNLHGVTSAAFGATSPAEREAGILETLGRMSGAERPPYLVTTAATHESQTALRELVREPPLFRTSSFSDEILIFATDYELLGRDARPRLPEVQAALAGLTEVDRVNVCDPRDEAAHGYAFTSRLGSQRLHGAARVAAYPDGTRVADAGRIVLGGERFTVRARPGKDLIVVMRMAPETQATLWRAEGTALTSLEVPEASLTVRVNGRLSSQGAVRVRAGWDETIVRVTANFVDRERLTLDMSGRYTSFHYWLYQ